MRTLEVRLDWGDRQVVVGTLAEEGRDLYFEYAPAFLEAALPISPFKLSARPGLFRHTDREFAPVFGLFDDSLPDSWGLLLMDREFRRQGRLIPDISPLDRLAYLGTRGMGALTYHPHDPDAFAERLDVELGVLAREAERVLEGSAEEVLPALRVAGGSPGGVRPKVLVGVRDDGRMIAGTGNLPSGFQHFLVKFTARQDRYGGAVEGAYAAMARAAGVDIPRTRLFETPDGGLHFGTERFDRRGGSRLHMHSLGGLWHASHRVASMDYEGFIRTTMALTRDHRQVEEAYRRMAFNVAAHNRDDHVKNFSFLMGADGAWTLAPAYDLIFSEGPGRQHTMDVAGEAERPGDPEMLRVARQCDIDDRRARAIIGEVRDAVARWPGFASEAGVPDETARQIRELILRRTG